jgi:hypothetical protein
MVKKNFSLFSDGKKFADRLQTARSFQSAAMKRGIECEGVAALAYSEVYNTYLV